jgi:hypothetical protein
MRKLTVIVVTVLLLLFAAAQLAVADTIDFETLTDQDTVNTQFSGVTFGGDPQVLTAQKSVNEYDFPPTSGVNVIFDANGPITVTFAGSVTDVSAYLTYLEASTLQIFDSSNTLVGTYNSLSSSNLGSNELFSLSYAGGISRAVFMGDPAGGSFTLDDLSFSAGPVSSVPEPTSLLLLATGAVVLTKKVRR